jgi:transposase, IS5 family
VDDDLNALGIPNPVIPRKSKTSKARQAHERRRAFRQVVKWRTGCEGRVSHLKRNCGWDRTRLDTLEGARTWTGHGVFAHNLTKIANLAAEQPARRARSLQPEGRRIRPNAPIPIDVSSSGRSS